MAGAGKKDAGLGGKITERQPPAVVPEMEGTGTKIADQNVADIAVKPVVEQDGGQTAKKALSQSLSSMMNISEGSLHSTEPDTSGSGSRSMDKSGVRSRKSSRNQVQI